MRRGWTTLGGLLGLLLLGLAATVAPAPAPAPLAAAETTQARAAGQDVARVLLRAPAGTFRAAAAQAEIALPAGSLLGGYASLWPRRSAAAGRVAVTALALATPHAQLVVTGLDAVTIAPALHAHVRAALDGQVAWIPSASHSHSGPGGCSHGLLERLFLGPSDDALLHTLADAHLQVIAQARAELQPAQLLDGSAEAPALVVHRSQRGAPIDATVDVLALVGHDRLLGRLVTHNAHATLVAARDQLDADYPGALRRVLAAADPSPLLFAAGATGSASAPRLVATDPAEAMGRALAAVVDEVPLKARSPELCLAWQRTWVQLPTPRIPLPAHLTLRPWLSRRLVDERVPLDVVRVDRAILIALPGELSAELSLALRRRAAALGWHLLFTSHNGVYAGYFMPAARYQAAGPEAALELHGPDSGAVFERFVDGLLEGLAAPPATASPQDAP